MLIEFDKLEEQVQEHFRGGEGSVTSRKYADDKIKISLGRLSPGGSIGLHTHTGNCEIIHVLSGSGVCHDDGTDVPLTAGMTHYCPEGHTHGIDNTGAEPLVLLGILPDVK